jgi:hypothetical protein
MPDDNFPLNVCFPDAAAIFNFRHKKFADIKNQCVIALDTNVLLAPYSLSDKDIASIESIYHRLSEENRLLIPAQVAREFARNRSAKLGDLVKTLQDQISKTGNPLGTQFSFLRLVPEYISALTLSQEIERKEKELADTLRRVLNEVRTWETTDPIWEIYRQKFESSIVELEAEALKNFNDELKFRNRHSIPPGYKDDKKADEGSGDLIIWKTILQEGKKRKSDMVFVTMEKKPDWWTQSANAPLYPRFELLEEFRAETGGQTIQLMRFSDFLEKFGAVEEVVQEVKRVENQTAASEDPEELFKQALPNIENLFRSKSEYIELQEMEKSLSQQIIEIFESLGHRLINRIQIRAAASFTTAR